jgi:peroxiredoxin
MLEDRTKAEQVAKEAADNNANQVQPLANYVDVLYRVDKKPQAIEHFARLKPLSSQLDLDLPICKRLEPLAKELGLSNDWRVPLAVPADAGQRPNLDSLGPFRWQPSPAPSWSLPDLNGAPVTMDQYRGKPVLMIFFLGSGCPHCIEQLNAFAPVTKEFLDAGISIVALSTDDVPGLKETFAQSKQDGMFPFPIISDHDLATFKGYRAFDDFENVPLHGAFLVDGAGLVRWQDISHQPYKEVRFLLTEAKRLLALPVGAKQVAAAPQ